MLHWMSGCVFPKVPPSDNTNSTKLLHRMSVSVTGQVRGRDLITSTEQMLHQMRQEEVA